MENNSPHNDKLKNAVLEKIRTGQVRMRPRVYFVLKVALLACVATLVLILSSFIFSFIFFSIQASGRMFLLGFGFMGFRTFIALFPWLPLIIDILLIIVLEQLIKRFKFGYRVPIVYLTTGIIVITAIIGFVINNTHVHSVLVRRAELHELPLIGGAYERVRRPPQDRCLFKGTVESVSTSVPPIMRLRVDEPFDGTTSITILLPPAIQAIQFDTDDFVFVACHNNHGQIDAFGIRKIVESNDQD